MVQLIRLASNDPTGLFNNQFNDDLIIEKFSKVALHSMTAEISTKQITIDAQNDEISFKLSGGNSPSIPYKVCNLVHGTYTASNVNTLLETTTARMNSKVSCDNSEVGRQWEVVNNGGKISFNLKIGKYIQPTSTDPNILALIGTVNVAASPASSANFTRSGGNVGTNDAYMWFKSPNCKGACSFSGRIYQPTNNQGFILAYLAEPPNTNTGAIDVADILYGIEFVSTSTLANGGTPYYRTYYNGTQYITVEQPQVVSATPGSSGNDYLSLDIGDASIIANIYRPNGVVVQLFSFPYDNISDLFPVIIFKGDVTSRVNGIKFNSDPVYNVTNDIQIQPIIEDIALGIPKNGSNAPTIKALKFGDIDLASILGFSQTEYITSAAVQEKNFLAEKAFTFADIADSFVIELLNIPLNSYDGLTHQRRNILHTVVQTDIVKERLTYTSPYPLYIDMNNVSKMSLREVRARILREDLNAVNLNGFSQITILISE